MIRSRVATGLATLTALCAGATAGCGDGGGVGKSSRSGRAAAAATPVRDRTTAPHAPPSRGGLHELRNALHHWFGRAGTASGGYVYDLSARQTVFALRDGIGRPPASVEKLYTTVALQRELGLGARLRTTVLGTGALGAAGVWHGDLYLRGGGDPTFGSATFSQAWLGGAGSNISDLVIQLTGGAGIKRVTGSMIADASLFDDRRGGPQTKYAADTPDFGGQLAALTYNHGAAVALPPDMFAAKQLAIALKATHVEINDKIVLRGSAPPSATRLASVSSPPVSVLLRLMDVPSDDFFAEMLTKQLGARFGGGGTIADGARVITDSVATYGIHPKVVDGSGLSREDRSSPRQVGTLLRAVWRTDVGRVLQASLPVVGVNGTVRRIAKGTSAEGRCVGKTGTLDAVTNLAGYCRNSGGHRLAFALFIDGVPNQRGVELLSRMVADMVRLNSAQP